MTKGRTVLLATALTLTSVAPAFGAASIRITDPQDQDFVNTGGGTPAPVTVTYQITGNICTGFRSSFAVQPYVNGVPVLCSGAGCGCDGTIENPAARRRGDAARPSDAECRR